MIISPTPGELPLSYPACVAIGNFDGVHVGHQALIHKARELGRENNLELVVLTFNPHPRATIRGVSKHHPLTSREEKFRLLKGLGTQYVLEIPFTPEFAELSPENFIQHWLCPLNPGQIVIGRDFSFGKNRMGSGDTLKNYGQKFGYKVNQIAPVDVAGQPVSSSIIRENLKAGHIARANLFLGRPYALSGNVGRGFGRGKDLGFPTANLENLTSLTPGNGVYATIAITEDGAQRAVTNIGRNPTFQGQKETVETFLLDASPNLYGKPLCLEFVEHLRNEVTFASPAELTAQINRDVENARRILAKLYISPDYRS